MLDFVIDILFVIVIFLTLVLILSPLYFCKGYLKFFYHDVLGWHEPIDADGYYDGCSQHNTCKHCGKDIMLDSQGNWF